MSREDSLSVNFLPVYAWVELIGLGIIFTKHIHPDQPIYEGEQSKARGLDFIPWGMFYQDSDQRANKMAIGLETF